MLKLYARPISLDMLIPQDVIWLEKALAEDLHGTTAREILDGVEQGRFTLWRLLPGIAVTTVVGKEMIIAYLAGENYLVNLAKFISEMEDVARSFGCRWLSGVAKRPGTSKTYSKFGKFQGTIYTREIL